MRASFQMWVSLQNKSLVEFKHETLLEKKKIGRGELQLN
jgi:hypothetical protein